MNLQPKYLPELQSSEDLTGAGGCISKVSRSYAWQVGSSPHGHLHGTA